MRFEMRDAALGGWVKTSLKLGSLRVILLEVLWGV